MKVLLSKNRPISPREQGDATDERIEVLDVYYQDRNGFNALHYVCITTYQSNNSFEIIKLLLDLGISVNEIESEEKENALQLLLQCSTESKDLLETVKCLVDQGLFSLND